MSRTLALVISYVLHPVLMPTLGVTGIMALSPHYIPQPIFLLVILYVFLGTYVLPSALILGLKKFGVISSIHLESANERRYPYLFTALFFYLTAQSVRSFQVPESVSVYLFAGVLASGVLMILLSFSKISAHMAGLGGLLGLTFFISYNYSMELLGIISLLILIAGLLATARLKLKAHTPIQVYTGFLVGFSCIILVLFGY